MRSILNRIVAAGSTGIIAASLIAPATAATRHKRAPAPEQSEFVGPSAARPDHANLPSVWRAPNQCVTDEGYGRYTSCEQGGF